MPHHLLKKSEGYPSDGLQRRRFPSTKRIVVQLGTGAARATQAVSVFPDQPIACVDWRALWSCRPSPDQNAGASSWDSISLNQDATSIPVQKDGPRSVRLPPAARPLPANVAESNTTVIAVAMEEFIRTQVNRKTAGPTGPMESANISKPLPRNSRPAASWLPDWTGTQWPANPWGTSNYIIVEQQ